MYTGGDTVESEQLEICFAGENDIDLTTLTVSLNNTLDVLNRIMEETTTSKDVYKFKVKNIEPGSFKIIIETLFSLAPTILPQVPTVLNTFKTILDIKKHLGGSGPREVKKVGEKVNITNMVKCW